MNEIVYVMLQVSPLEHDDRISTPPPAVSPVAGRQQYTKPARSSRSQPAKTTREPSLTTITEESCNQSIVVQPEVVVEYSNPVSVIPTHSMFFRLLPPG